MAKSQQQLDDELSDFGRYRDGTMGAAEVTVLLEADEKQVAREHEELKPEPVAMLMAGTHVKRASEVVEELRREYIRSQVGRL